MSLISVVMPTLNTADFIGKCLKSVTGQTFKDIEILVVDAGSVDGTLEIVESFAAVDQRIKLTHSDIKSYGYQLNKGIEAARGKYLAIVEPDDYIAEDMLEDLYTQMELHGLDYVKADNYFFWELESGDIYRGWSCAVPNNLYNVVFNPRNHREIHLSDIHLWNGIYDISFLKRHNIRANESNGAAYQDVGFLFQTIGYAEKVMYLNKAYYYYRRNNESSSIYSSQGLQYIVGEYTYIYNLLRHTEIWENIANQYYIRMFAQFKYRIQIMAAGGKKWEGIEESVYTIRDRLRKGMDNGMVDRFALDMDTWLDLTLLLQDADMYVDFYMAWYAGKRNLFHAFYDRAGKYDTIVFYSCSNLGKYVCSLLEAVELEANIVFCDNDQEKQGKLFAGKSVYSCEEVAVRYPGAFYIIANNRYSDDMSQQLLRLGVQEKNIFRYKWDCDPLNRIL